MTKEQILNLSENVAFVAFEEENGKTFSKSLEKIGFLDRSNRVQPKIWNRGTSASGPNPDTELYLVEIVGENPKGTVYFLKILCSLKEVRQVLSPTEKWEQAQAMLANYIRRELPELDKMPNLLVNFNGRDAYKEITIAGKKFTVDVDLDRLYYGEVERFVEGMKGHFTE